MRTNGIMKWRYIDPKELAERVKALPLGSEDKVDHGEVVGLGGPNSADTKWRRKVAQIASRPQSQDERWQEILADQRADEKRIRDVNKRIDKRKNKTITGLWK